MGNSPNARYVLQKGEGYRIISVKPNSPFHGKVDQFFDFILEVIPLQSEKKPTDILDKLSNESVKKIPQPLLQVLNENIDKVVKVKIVSTKYRKVRLIQITPNSKWNDSNDVIGVSLRREKYDQAFETYYPVTAIQNNSPIKKAAITEQQYLIGCIQFGYASIDAFIEGLYQRYFDKQNNVKTVHLAIYDIPGDILRIKQVTLKRGWGGKGLLGCDFLQGSLHKFPLDLQKQRQQMITREKQKKQIMKLRNQLGECDGVSKSLVEALQNQRSKKARQYKNIKNILNVSLPDLGKLQPAGTEAAIQKLLEGQKQVRQQVSAKQKQSKRLDSATRQRIETLELRVTQLQQTLTAVKQYLEGLQQNQE